jgi:hypothetical protein
MASVDGPSGSKAPWHKPDVLKWSNSLKREAELCEVNCQADTEKECQNATREELTSHNPELHITFFMLSST